MRVNVYGEELTDRMEVLTREVVEPGSAETFTFYGLRLWLKFPNQPWWVHRKVDGGDDDDSSALTIWAPTREALAGRLRQAVALLDGDES